MKNFLLTTAVCVFTVLAAAAQGPRNVHQVINDDFSLIAQELKPEPLQLHQISKALEEKAEEIAQAEAYIVDLKARAAQTSENDTKSRAYIENELSNAAERLKQLHRDKDNAVEELLNEEQAAKYRKEILPALAEKRKAFADQAKASK